MYKPNSNTKTATSSSLPGWLVNSAIDISAFVMLFVIYTAELFAGTTSGQILRVYDAGSRTTGDGAVVPHDSQRVFADFRFRNWQDDYYEWVSVRLNGGQAGERISLSSLQRAGDTVNLIPLNVRGVCGAVEAVVWVGRRNASPIKSDPFRFHVDCQLPQISVRAYSLGVIGGGRYTTPRELRAGECSDGSGHRFDIQISDDHPVSVVSTNLEGRSLRSGSGREIHYDTDSMPVRQELSFSRNADTPGSTRPRADSFLTLELVVKESSGRQTRQTLRLLISGTNAASVRITQPANRSLIPASNSWRITGKTHSYGCAHRPEQVDLWHTIPGGMPRKMNTVRVDSSGGFIFSIPARTIPVGKNTFNIDSTQDNSRTGRHAQLSTVSESSQLQVQITPLGKDTVRKIQTPGVPGLSGGRKLPDRPLVETLPLVNTTAPAAEKVMKSAPPSRVESIQKNGLSEKAIQGINP